MTVDFSSIQADLDSFIKGSSADQHAAVERWVGASDEDLGIGLALAIAFIETRSLEEPTLYVTSKSRKVAADILTKSALGQVFVANEMGDEVTVRPNMDETLLAIRRYLQKSIRYFS